MLSVWRSRCGCVRFLERGMKIEKDGVELEKIGY